MEKKLKRRVGQNSFPLAIGMGMVLSLAIALALLMVMALILYRTQDPTAYIGVLSLIPLGIGGFLCGVLVPSCGGTPPPCRAWLAGVCLPSSSSRQGFVFPAPRCPLACGLAHAPASRCSPC